PSSSVPQNRRNHPLSVSRWALRRTRPERTGDGARRRERMRARMRSKGTAMRQVGFHPELRALLEDPITGHVMASAGVAMSELVALLQTARRRLAAQGQKQARQEQARKAKGRRGAGPSIAVETGSVRLLRGA